MVARRHLSGRRAILTAELRQQFHELLITWPLRDARGLCAKDPWPRVMSVDTDPLELERDPDFGDGHFDERHERMDYVLGKLEERGRTYFEIAFKALQESRQAYFDQSLGGRLIDRRREIIERRDKLVKNLRDAIKEFKWLVYAMPIKAGIAESLEIETVKACDELLRQLGRDEFLNLPPPGPLRRKRIGKPSRPWLQTVKSELAKAGVPDTDTRLMGGYRARTELLICCGLRPYEPELKQS